MKPGYKQTEVGVIPEDWEILPALNACDMVVDCKNRTPPVTAESEYAVVRTPNVRDGRFVDTDLRFTDVESYHIWTARTVPKVGDIMITREAPLGEVCAVPADRKVCLGQRMMLYRPAVHKTDSNYLLFALTSAPVRANLIRKIGGSTVGHAKVDDIRNLLVPIPSLLEQRAIAEALSDVDGLLGGLDRLIAKKRDLKQAAIQQLLTAQSRFPGFDGEWVTKSFGELFDFSGGYSASRDELSTAGHPYLHYGDIHTSNRTMVDVSADHADIPKLDIPLKCVSRGSLLEDGDVVFVDASEDDEGTSKHVVVVNKEGRPFISGLHTIVAKAKSQELVHAYRRFCFQTRAIKEQFKFYAVGTKVSGISKSNIPKLTLPLPPPDEQTAIAEVMTQMDEELAALERRRDKTRAIKQAMMQQLLTGQTRLVTPATSNIVSVSFAAPTTVPPAAPAPADKKHNWAINEAVVLSVLVKHFGSEKFPLGRKRCTKLSYLLHRHVEHVAHGYLKKAAGPYNPDVKYRGPEGIAQKNGYIRQHKNGNFSGYIAADKITQAEGYFDEWYGADVLRWLDQFRFKSNDDLERLATVDMAMEEVRRGGKKVSLTSVHDLIGSEPEWVPKLQRDAFSEPNISAAIQQCAQLFS